MQTTWKKLALGLGVTGGLMLQTTCTADVRQALSDAAIAGLAAAVESAIEGVVSNNLPPDDDN